MVDQRDELFERVVQRIAPRGRLLKCWALSGGISAEMSALEFEEPGGAIQKMVVRRPGAETLSQNPQAAQDEFRTLQLTHSFGLATPRPVDLDLTGQIFSTPYLVMEYIEGQPDFARDRPIDFSRQLAAQLAKIHGAPLSKRDASFLEKPALRFEDLFGERPYHADLSCAEDRLRDTLKSIWPIPCWNAPCLLHGDYWPGNLLWRDERLVAVIDWEDAGWGDPLADFAISRLDLLWIFGRDVLESFSEHYLSLRPGNTRWLPYWDFAAALRLARLVGTDLSEWAAFFLPYGRPDITEQTIRENVQFFVDQAFEKLAG